MNSMQSSAEPNSKIYSGQDNAVSTVLIVDDDARIVESFRCVLVDEGYCVLTALNAMEALELLKANCRPNINGIDAVLSDIRMPDLNGLELLDRIGKIDSTLPVILMTGYADLDVSIDVLKRRVFDYLEKPIRIDRLIDSIDKAVTYSKFHRYKSNYMDIIRGSSDDAAVSASIRPKAAAAYAYKRALETKYKAILEARIAQRTEQLLKQMEEMRIIKEAACESAKLKSYLLDNISHELRTPLFGVTGMLEIALGECENPELAEYLQYAFDSAQVLVNKINSILSYSSVENLRAGVRLEEFDLWDELDRITAPFEKAARHKNLSFKLHIDPDAPKTVLCDREKLALIIRHLTDNAVKFTHEGEVRVWVRSLRKVYQDKTVGSLAITVSDTGIGIEDNNINLIFGGFCQLEDSINNKYEGMGIGLATAKKLAELLGGNISVNSTRSKGSDFHLLMDIKTC